MFQNIDEMFSNPDLANSLNTTCKDDNQCKEAINERKKPDFTKQAFKRQASTFRVLIDRLIAKMVNTYNNMTQNNSDCLTKIAELCGTYESHSLFKIKHSFPINNIV